MVANNSTHKSTTKLADAIALSSQIRPTTVYKTSDRLQAVKIRQDADHASSQRTPISVPDQFQKTCIEYADFTALRYQHDGDVTWQSVSYSQYREQVLRTAKAFINLGLSPHYGVGILANNSPEWFYSFLGGIHAGGVCSGIYTTNSPDAVYHVLHDSNANIVIVDSVLQMKKIREIRERLPMLKAVIQTHGPYEEFVNGEDGYYRWSEIMASNYGDEEPELINRLSNMRVNECCSLVYTSGTVGNPKGVMISHDNLTWNAWSTLRNIPKVQPGKETIISYLPLSHIAAQIVDILFGITIGMTVYFADKDALKGTLINTLLVAQPTRFIGVPRVYEKIHEKLMSIGAKTTGIKKALATWSKSHTLQHWMDHINNGSTSESLRYKFARYVVMNRIKDALGFSRCQTLLSAAAPMSEDIKKYFLSLNLPIVEAFGMSETTGAHCVGQIEIHNLSTLGLSPEGIETKIINRDENGHGEILMKGRHVCMGYLNEPAKVEEALDDDGYMHSGDLGYVDQNGLLYITGRLKDLLITAGGENIPPSKIEHTILNELHVLSNAFLVGDKRKFLTALVTLKTEVDLESGEPKDDLAPVTVTWVESLGLSYKHLSEIIAAGPCPKILGAIEDAVKRANKHSTSNAQNVQKIALLPRDFSFLGGELGPTLKVKRNVVSVKYAETIEQLYAN